MALLTFPIPSNTYNIGSQTIASSPVPVGATQLLLIMDAANWTNPLSILDIAMELSLDNGVTWQPGGRAPMQCRPDGTFRGPAGTILTEAKSSFSWPAGVTHARGTVTIRGASIQTGGTVEVN
jgi:hypothetical protein